MNYTVRLYWQHDLDLIALYAHPDFPMAGWIKRAVTAWARNTDHFSIPLPVNAPNKTVSLHNATLHFRLSVHSDEDVIMKLNSIRKGFRNTAVKLILRNYLEKQYISPFYYSDLYDVKLPSFVAEKEEVKNTSPKSTHNNIPKETDNRKDTQKNIKAPDDFDIFSALDNMFTES